MKTYRTDEIAGILQIDVETVRRFIKEGRIVAFKAGKEWRVMEEDLLKYINDNKVDKGVM